MDTTDKVLIMYHNEDNDGTFSAAIAYTFFVNDKKLNKKQIVLEGTNYGALARKYPKKSKITALAKEYTYVVMVDVSFNDIERMKDLVATFGNKFIWIDHHRPVIQCSIAEGFDCCPGWRDTSRSALLNTYRYFFDPLDIAYSNKTVPELLRILSAYDSWSYEREGYSFEWVNYINKGVTDLLNLDVKETIKLVNSIIIKNKPVNINKYYAHGKLLTEYDDRRYENQLKAYGDPAWTVNGRPAVMLIIQGPTYSGIFKKANEIFGHTDEPYYKNGIILRKCRTNWNMSIYNINEDKTFHCGDYIKEKYNGGGHAGAAGCELTNDDAFLLLRKKKI